MMSKIIAFCMVIVVVNAATWTSSLSKKPKELAHKKGCYVKEINDVVPFGDNVTPLGVCHRIQCTEQMMRYVSCGVITTNDPKCYKTKEDLSRPYPACCSKIKCDTDNNLV